jgi:hypothetical protein
MNPDDDAELDTDDRLLIDVLASGYTHEEAGAILGFSAKWVQRRRRRPAFKIALEQRRRDHNAALAAKSRSIARRAMEVLLEEMEPDRPGATRLRAAQIGLDSSRRCNADEQSVNDAERLDGVEEAIERLSSVVTPTIVLVDDESPT